MDPHECAVCGGPYRAPKFLPCFHTFCAMCVQGVADSSSEDGFPCPDCQVTTSLPPGGVDFLPTNSYIILNEDHPEQVGDRELTCEIHNDQTLDFFCTNCDAPLCIDCKLREHANHETETLTMGVSLKRTELQKEQRRMMHAICVLKDNVASLKEEKRALEKKYEPMAEYVQNRHTSIVTSADSILEEKLDRMHTRHMKKAHPIDCEIAEQEGYKADLSDLLQNAKDTVASGTDGDVLTVAKEMTSGRGSQRATDVMLPQQDRLLYRPVLHVDVSTFLALKAIGQYMGKVQQTQMKKTVPEMKVTGGFQCREDPYLEVFSLCHSDTVDRVLVSYDTCESIHDAFVEEYNETGELEGEYDIPGRVSCRGYSENLVLFSDELAGYSSTFNKSPTAALFSLVSKAGEAKITRHMVTSLDPYIYEERLEFKIKVPFPRVFDVDDTEQYFAVVADAKSPTLRRSVHLFRRSEKKAVSTYTPPTEDCLPSDVCFYTLRGQKVLLITDERTNSIHVATIEGDSLQFVRYLCVDCPSLIQPTAITVDVYRRLWLASAGGTILTMEQIE